MKSNHAYFWSLATGIAVAVALGLQFGSWWVFGFAAIAAWVAAGLFDGIVPVRVFCWGFVAGVVIEYLGYQLVNQFQNAELVDDADRYYPLTFLFERSVWPSSSTIFGNPLFDEQLFKTSFANHLKAWAAGVVSSGIVFGAISLFVWYRAGGRHLSDSIAARIRAMGGWIRGRWMRQSIERRRLLRAASWLLYGAIVAVMIAGGWWRWFKPVVAIGAATSVFALIALISFLDARRSISK